MLWPLLGIVQLLRGRQLGEFGIRELAAVDRSQPRIQDGGRGLDIGWLTRSCPSLQIERRVNAAAGARDDVPSARHVKPFICSSNDDDAKVRLQRDRAGAVDRTGHGRAGITIWIHHSDRGVQYASHDYRAALAAHGITTSMSRKDDCYDNALMESFFHTLKTERVYHRQYATRAEAQCDIFAYIEGFYNRTRRHSAIGYVSPIEMELKAA
jgi:hypothetical protein